MKDISRFLQEVNLELLKVLWPSFNELTSLVVIVMLLVCFFSIYIGFIDIVFYKIAGIIF